MNGTLRSVIQLGRIEKRERKRDKGIEILAFSFSATQPLVGFFESRNRIRFAYSTSFEWWQIW